MSTTGALDEVQTDTEGLKVFRGLYKKYMVTYKGFQYLPFHAASLKGDKWIARCSKNKKLRCLGRLHLSFDLKKVLLDGTAKHNHQADPVECARRYEMWLADKISIPELTTAESVVPVEDPVQTNESRTKPPVWNDDQKTVLVNLVAPQYNFLFGEFFNKARKKSIVDTWSKITEQLNAVGDQNRDMKRVKKKYMDLKALAKKKAARCLKRIIITKKGEQEEGHIRAALSTAITSLKGYEKTLIGDIGYSAILKEAESFMIPDTQKDVANKNKVLKVAQNDDDQDCSPAKKRCPGSNLGAKGPSYGEQYGREALQLINSVFTANKLPIQCGAPAAENFEEIVNMNPDLQRFFYMKSEGHYSLSYDTSMFKSTGLNISQMLKKESLNWPPFIWINIIGVAVPTLAPVDNLLLKRPNGTRCEYGLHGIVTRIKDCVYEALFKGDCGNFVKFDGTSVSGPELANCLLKGSAASFLYGIIDKGVLAELHPAESKIISRSAVKNQKIKEIWQKDQLLHIKVDIRKRPDNEFPGTKIIDNFSIVEAQVEYLETKISEKLTEVQKKATELLNLKTQDEFMLTDKESKELAIMVHRRATTNREILYFSDGRFCYKSTRLLCQVCLTLIRSKRRKGPAYCSIHEPNRSELRYAALLLRPTFNTAIARPVVEIASKDSEFGIRNIKNTGNKIITNKRTVPSEFVSGHTELFDSLLEAESYLRGQTVCSIFHSIFEKIPMHTRYHLGAHRYEFVRPSLVKISEKFGIHIELGKKDHSQNLSLEMAQKYGVIFPIHGTYDQVPLVYTRVHEIDHTKRLIYVGKNSNPTSFVSHNCKYIEPRKVLETTAVILTPYKHLLPTLESATQMAYILAMCLGITKNGHEIILQNRYLEVHRVLFADTSFLDYVKLIFLYEFNYNIEIEKLG